jgi:uncharacterized protein (TIGR00369 family)
VALQIPPNCDLTLGMVCVDKSTPGTTVWTMRADERFLNPAGIVQGGFLAAMLDSAMGASAVTGAGERKVQRRQHRDEDQLSAPAAPGSQLTCTARVLKSGSVICFVEARIIDDHDRLVATASSTYLLKDRPD